MIKTLQKKFMITMMIVTTLLLAAFLTSVNVINHYSSARQNRAVLDRIISRNVRMAPGNTPNGGSLIAPEMPDGMKAPNIPEDPPPNSGMEQTEREIPPSPSPLDPGANDLGQYLIVQISKEGKLLFSDLTHDPDLTEAGMLELLGQVKSSLLPKILSASEETETEAMKPVREEGGNVPPPEKPDGSDESFDKNFDESLDGSLDKMKTPENQGVRTEEGKAAGYFYYLEQRPDGSVTGAFLNIARETAAELRLLLITGIVGAVTWLLVLLISFFLSRKAIAPVAESIRRQQEFVTNAGHELKTPLAIISMNVDVQEMHLGSTNWLSNIRTQTERLTELTRQLLMLSKMEEADHLFLSQTFDLDELMLQSLRSFRASAEKRNITLAIRQGQVGSVFLSKDLCLELLNILFDNAVKYAKEDSTLEAASVRGHREITLTISNECDQLPDVEPEHLFERFYRADSSRSRSTGGSGIGLAAARAITDHLGGSIHAAYGPEKRITFTVVLPQKKLNKEQKS